MYAQMAGKPVERANFIVTQAKSAAEMSLLSLAAHRVALLWLHLGSDHYVERTLWPLAGVGSTAAIGGAGDSDGILTAFPVGDSYSVDWVIVFSSILLW